MFDIENQYNDNINGLHKLVKLIYDADGVTIDDQINAGMVTHELEKAVEKAKLYDIMRYKQSQAGKKAARNMTQRQRIERAKKASQARKNVSPISANFIKTKIQY